MTKKRPLVPSTAAADSDKTLTGPSNKLRRTSSAAASASASACASAFFNDSSTADVVLRLYAEPSKFETDGSDDNFPEQSDIIIHLHSDTIRRSKYFAALLSERWQHDSNSGQMFRFNLGVSSSSGSIRTYLTVLELLYTNDFANTIESVSIALDILPIALEILFEDCVKSCVKFLEAVPWSDEEEVRVINLIPLLSAEESQELLARVSPEKDSCDEIVHRMIPEAKNNFPNTKFVKTLVPWLFTRYFSSTELAKRALDRAFGTSLKVVKEELLAYYSPNFGGDQNEKERIQNKAMMNVSHLLWLVETMIKLRVADSAVKEWSEQESFTADLQGAFHVDASWNFVEVVLSCTCKLANAVAAGTILVPRQDRMKLVTNWLPVLIVYNDESKLLPSHRSVCQELKDTLLRIISTLPMSDAMELLPQCLSLSFYGGRDFFNLLTAFHTWFSRATRSQQSDHID